MEIARFFDPEDSELEKYPFFYSPTTEFVETVLTEELIGLLFEDIARVEPQDLKDGVTKIIKGNKCKYVLSYQPSRDDFIEVDLSPITRRKKIPNPTSIRLNFAWNRKHYEWYIPEFAITQSSSIDVLANATRTVRAINLKGKPQIIEEKTFSGTQTQFDKKLSNISLTFRDYGDTDKTLRIHNIPLLPQYPFTVELRIGENQSRATHTWHWSLFPTHQPIDNPSKYPSFHMRPTETIHFFGDARSLYSSLDLSADEILGHFYMQLGITAEDLEDKLTFSNFIWYKMEEIVGPIELDMEKIVAVKRLVE
jgi:hypothetical protein